MVHTICDLLEELRPTKPSGVVVYRDLIEFVTDRPGHDARYAIDAAKIERDLGWRPQETFETGLRKRCSGTSKTKAGGARARWRVSIGSIGSISAEQSSQQRNRH